MRRARARCVWTCNSLLHLTEKSNSNKIENNQEKNDENITEPITLISAHSSQARYNKVILGTANNSCPKIMMNLIHYVEFY